MTWAIPLLLVVYVALKAGQIAFLGRASGYRDEPIGVAQRLRAGEPALLIAAMLLTVPPAVAATWYHQHKFGTALATSLACYGLIAGYRDTPEIMRSNGEHAVYEAFSEYGAIAADAAWQLGMTAEDARRRLDRAAAAFDPARPGGGGRVRRDRIAATQRCLHQPRGSPDA